MAKVLKLLEFAVDLLGCASVTIDAQCRAGINNAVSIIDCRFVIVSILYLSIFALAKTIQRECSAVPSTTIIGFAVVNVHKLIIFLTEARPISTSFTDAAGIIVLINIYPLVYRYFFFLALLALAEPAEEASSTGLRHINVSRTSKSTCFGVFLVVGGIIRIIDITLFGGYVRYQLIPYRGE